MEQSAANSMENPENPPAPVNTTTVKAPVVNITQGGADHVEANEVNLLQGGINTVQARTMTVKIGGVNQVTTDEFTLKQGGIVKVQANTVDVTQGGIIYAQTQDANLETSSAQLIIAQGDARLEQSGAQLMIAQGDVEMEQSGAVVMVARKVQSQNGMTIFLLAQKIEGNLKAVFGPLESILFGAAAGIVFFLLSLLTGQMKKRGR